MIKSICVPASGSETDVAVFATALAVARPLAAHLDFYHISLSTGEAAPYAAHLDFCVGSALPEALKLLKVRQEQLRANAAAHFKSFCSKHTVDICYTPRISDGVSARWLEEKEGAASQLVFHARHSDLVVPGRSYHVDSMPRMLMEDLLFGCGRPIVIAPQSPPKTVTGTIVVGWKKKTPESARALAAAYPLLAKARHVVLLSVAEEESDTLKSLENLAQQLKWDGIAAEPRVIAKHPKEDLAAQLRLAGFHDVLKRESPSSTAAPSREVKPD